MQGTKLKDQVNQTIGTGNMVDAVKLPPGEDIKEWHAVNVVDFYNAISILYGTLEYNCTS